MKKSARGTLSLLILLALSTPVWADPAWIRATDVTGQPSTKPVKGGGGIAVVGDFVYLIVGNNTPDFMKYSIVDNTWAAIAPGVPVAERKKKNVKKGAYIVDDGTNIYIFKGASTNEFYKYSIADNLWTALPSPEFTKGIKGGFAVLVNLMGKQYIYAGSGSNTAEWKRFDLLAGAWEAAMPAALPVEKAKVGSGLAFDGGNLLYFLTSRGKTNSFFVTNLADVTPVWTEKRELPVSTPSGGKKKVKEGGCLLWFNNLVYAVKGGSTKEFWYFDPAADSWSYVGEVGDGAATKGIKCGRSIATDGDLLFCVIGNNTNEFWYYTPPVAEMSSLRPAVAGSPVPMTGGALSTVPNPARGGTTISCQLPVHGAARLTVYNSAGRAVYRAASITGSFGSVRLPAGTYVVRVDTGASVAESNLVVLE